MNVIYPPEPILKSYQAPTVFLAGSIEMGNAPDWQQEFLQVFENEEVTFFNPRRKDWDSSWEQRKDHPQFSSQVNWELSALETADLIVMYLAPKTQSPISLLELGLFAHSGKLLVCCPDGFWRKGNVAIVAQRYGIREAPDLASLLEFTKQFLAQNT